MESAARSVVDSAVQMQQESNCNRSAIILCGKGNNGGDGFAIARLLQDIGWQVIAVLYCNVSELRGDALTNYLRMKDVQINLPEKLGSIEIRNAIVIDAIYGTGFKPPSSIDFKLINRWAEEHSHQCIAVDVPSGMDALDGTVTDQNAIRADKTVTLVCEKSGFVSDVTRNWTGKVIVADIGVPEEIVKRVSKGS